MVRKTQLRPGQIADISGQYKLQGARGADLGGESTIVRREPAPPTPKKGQSWKLTDPTKHRTKRKK